jgi:hypothetical protein
MLVATVAVAAAATAAVTVAAAAAAALLFCQQVVVTKTQLERAICIVVCEAAYKGPHTTRALLHHINWLSS